MEVWSLVHESQSKLEGLDTQIVATAQLEEMGFVNFKGESDVLMPFGLSEDLRIQNEESDTSIELPNEIVTMEAATKKTKRKCTKSNIESKPLRKRKSIPKVKASMEKLKCCGRRFRTHDQIRGHRLGFTSYKAPFECGHCKEVFQYPCQLHTHRQKKNHAIPTKMVPCTECDKLFTSEFKLSIHMKFHNANRDYVCKPCNLQFQKRVGLNRHLARCHNGVSLKENMIYNGINTVDEI